MLRMERIAPGGDLSAAFKVRTNVFVDEQGFSAELEIDDIDPISNHIVFFEDNEPIATARTFPDKKNPGYYVIGRVSICKSHRGTGLGLNLMAAIEELAAELGATGFTLGAQLRARPFYEKCGYSGYGEHYYEEYCEHVHMKKRSGKEFAI